MYEHTMFRFKIFQNRQLDLFTKSIDNKHDFLIEVMKNREEIKGRYEGLFWCASNAEAIDKHGILFQFGKHKPGFHSTWDKDGKTFCEVGEEEGFFTNVYIATDLEVCCISHNYKLFQNILDASKTLSMFLNSQKNEITNGCRFEISPLHNIDSFLEKTIHSYEIVSYELDITRPNPTDVDEDIYGPLEKVVEESGSDTMKIRMRGKEIRRDKLKNVIRTAAAVGNQQSAIVRFSEKDKVTRLKSDKKDIASIKSDAPLHLIDPEDFYTAVRNKYKEIRDGKPGDKR